MKTQNLPALVVTALCLSCSGEGFPEGSAHSKADPVTGSLCRRPAHSSTLAPRCSLFSVSSKGELCELSTETGQRHAMLSGKLEDITFRESSRNITTIEESSTGIELIRRGSAAQDWPVQSTYSLSAESARLLYSGDYDIGLAYDMGASLFVAHNGYFWGKSVGTPTSAQIRKVRKHTIAYLLNAQLSPWGIVGYDVAIGGIKQVSLQPVQQISFLFTPRMIDTGHEFLLTEAISSSIVLRRSSGEILNQVPVQEDTNGFVEDVIWNSTDRSALALSGPIPYVHSIPIHGTAQSIRIDEQGEIYHDESPRRLLAYDSTSRRLFVGMKYRVVAIDLLHDGTLQLAKDFSGRCSGTAVLLE